MFRITILALGAIIASNACADHQAIKAEAGPFGPRQPPAVNYQMHEAIKLPNKTGHFSAWLR
jgi:hypothetical protein